MRRRSLLVLVVAIPAVLLPSVVMSAGPTSAASAVARVAAAPVVGDCFDLADELLQAGGYWVQPAAVPCSQPHTFEVTETGPIPQDVNAFDFAAERCGELDVWTAVRVNPSTAGIVEDPIRIEARSFAVRQAKPGYVCGAVAVTLNGRKPPTAVRLTSAIDRLRPREAAGLRHCASAANGRSAFAPPITVPCSTRPRWQVTAWILWSALYDDFPGRTVLRERAERECDEGAVFAVPTATSWSGGSARTWCYVRYS